MISRSRALFALSAVALLALPAAALMLRVTLFFSADFEQPGAPGQSPPIVAQSGNITISGPGFSVVKGAEGGSLVATGSAVDSLLTGSFDKTFIGAELQLGWGITPCMQSGYSCLSAMEDTDGEVIDVGWGGDGWVWIDDTPVGEFEYGSTYDCSLILRKNLTGAASWLFTMTKVGGQAVSFSGPLDLNGPLTVKSLQILVPAGTVGTATFDDIQALSVGVSANK